MDIFTRKASLSSSRTSLVCLMLILAYLQCLNGLAAIDCHSSIYGCCLDGITPAEGPNYENCSMKSECESSEFGCCSDDLTPAKGPYQDGCIDNSCRETEFGCCDDQVTPAKTIDLTDCPSDCFFSLYGCCENSTMAARGSNNAGCSNGEHEADLTASNASVSIKNLRKDIKYLNVVNEDPSLPCANKKYECCPDGVTSAKGPGFQGCIEETSHVKHAFSQYAENLCTLPEPKENCYNYTLQWRYSLDEGRCVQFWYGGCDSNQNMFDSSEQCENKCVKPNGTDVCKLPLVNPLNQCQHNVTRYFYDTSLAVCKQFIYSGCHGNANNFESFEECETSCQVPLLFESCSFIPDKGPCRGNFQRWYFDAKVGRCKTFEYGGCNRNTNNHLTESSCVNTCVKPKQNAVCLLPKIVGTCNQFADAWFYDFKESKCKKFSYSGCNGNLNRFESKDACDYTCQGMKEVTGMNVLVEKVCQAPKKSGMCHSDLQRWYFNKTTQMCHQFTYSGCDYNTNNFETEENCRSVCNAKEVDPCVLPLDHGTCDKYKIYWHFNQAEKECVRFYFGGCDGNQNRFETRESCEMECKMSDEEKTELLKLPKQCRVPMEYGTNCEEVMSKWYFDHRTKSCYPFEYSGCGPELSNRFDDSVECKKICIENENDNNEIAPALVNIDDKNQDLITSTPLVLISSSPKKQPDLMLKKENSIDLCELPMAKGNCSQNDLKWFYDHKTKYCRNFEFTGCNGNENRFETRHQCTEICEIPKRREICNSNKVKGPCSDSLKRWYHDTDKKMCIEFVFGGCLGNDNNFESKTECKNFCWDYLSDEERASKQTEISTVSNNSNNFDSIESPNDNSKHKKVDNFVSAVDASLSISSENPCEYPVDIAVQCLNEQTFEILPSKFDGTDLLWFYDIESHSCKYINQDCVNSENINRFQSHDACKSQCIPNVTDVQTQADCLLPIQIGELCSHQIWRWYYDYKAGQCYQFSYSGCHGNNNNFISGKSCMWLCAAVGTQKCPDLDECSNQCEYGRVVSLNNCELCDCVDPCENVKCPEDHECVVENSTHVCRSTKKIGACPEKSSLQDKSCKNTCSTDANCESNFKCCPNSCSGMHCVAPSFDQKISIDLFSGHLNIEAGVDLVLPCKASGYPTPSISWFKNHQEISFSQTDSRIMLAANKSLIILNVTDKDQGVYSCRASNSNGKAVVKECNVSINVALHLKLNGESVKYELFGVDVVLVCSIYGNPLPKLKWKTDKFEITSNPFKYIIMTNMLVVKRFDRSDIGNYTCYASNRVGRTISSTMELRKAVPGEVKFDFMEISADVNTSVVLSCNYSGLPIPNVKWFKSNFQPISNRSENSKYEMSKNYLKINSLKYTDSGIYRCSAFNQFSHNYMKKKHGTIKLSVNSPPIIISKSAKIQAKPATFALLDCQANGIPKPEVTWYKNNKIIAKVETLSVKYTFSPLNGSLTIHDLNDDDSGYYYCFASSLDRYPIASLNYSFIVSKSYINYTETILVDETETVNLLCKIPLASNVLENSWIFNESSKIETSSSKFTLVNDKSRLKINAIAVKDSGIYQCFTKTNKPNNYLTKYIVIVNPKPVKVQFNTKEIKSVANKSIILDCTWWFTDSNLLFNKNTGKNFIEWRLNDTILAFENDTNSARKYEFLDNSNTLLLVKNLEIKESSDVYTCLFKFDRNSIKKSIFNIYVGVSPYLSYGYLELNNTQRLQSKHETITLDCPIQGIPVPVRSWYFNFTQIEPETEASIYTFDNRTGMLKINEMDKNSEGLYVCKSHNEYGATSFAQSLELAEEPVFLGTETVKETIAYRGENVLLKCEFVGGRPKPIVSWMFEQKLINTNENEKYSLSSTYDTLEIKDVKKSDNGLYTCILSNGYHAQKLTNLTLKVLEPLKAEILAETPLFKVNKEGKIKCSLINGDSQSYEVEWYKNEVKLRPSKKYTINQNILSIRSLAVSDSGKYECHISLDKIKTTKSIFVNVIDDSKSCEDVSSYANCKMIASKGLCSKWGRFCCKTCSSNLYV